MECRKRNAELEGVYDRTVSAWVTIWLLLQEWLSYPHMNICIQSLRKIHMEQKKQQNFESSDIITHRLQAKNCLLLRCYWLLGWWLHHIKAPCQVGAFGRSTTRECSFPLMFWTPYCRVSLGGKLWIITTWEDDADVPHQTYCHMTLGLKTYGPENVLSVFIFNLFVNYIKKGQQ